MEARRMKEESVLLRYQRRFINDPAPVKVCEKSRRVGMTYACAAHAVLVAGSGKQDVWYSAYNEDQAKEFCLDCVRWIERLQIVVAAVDQELVEPDEQGNLKGIKVLQISFPSGKRITCLTSHPRNLRGKQGLVILDEVAFVEDLSELLKSALALTVWGGEVWVLSTHNGVDNLFNKLVEDIHAGKLPYKLHRVTMEDAVRDGLYRRICRTRGQEWSLEAERAWFTGLLHEYGSGAEEELLCIPSRGGVAYFDRDVVESRMVKGRAVLRLYLSRDFTSRPEKEREKYVSDWLEAELAPRLAKLPRDRQHFLGQDFGRTADLSVMMPGTLLADLTRDVPFIVELSNVPFEPQRQVAFFVLDRLPRFTRAHFDATGNGAYLAEVCAQRYGNSRVVEVKIGERWHLESWPPLRAAFEEDKIRLPSDEEIRADFMAVKRTQGIPKLPSAVVLKVDEGDGTRTIRRHGDAAVACAMLYAATRSLEDAIGRGEQWKRAALGM
jgi:phage FluMu gp28-like protein